MTILIHLTPQNPRLRNLQLHPQFVGKFIDSFAQTLRKLHSTTTRENEVTKCKKNSKTCHECHFGFRADEIFNFLKSSAAKEKTKARTLSISAASHRSNMFNPNAGHHGGQTSARRLEHSKFTRAVEFGILVLCWRTQKKCKRVGLFGWNIGL